MKKTRYGWIVVAACALNYIFALGLTYGFGVYQREYYYENTFPGATQFQLSWAGSISAATQFLVWYQPRERGCLVCW